VYTLDKKLCVNCGKCIEACPFNVLVKAKERDTPSKCIACGICVKNCPMDILYVKEDAEEATA
jgi:ferredoxin